MTYYDENCVLLVVADGHGGAPYVRSGFGARIACTVACDVLKDLVFNENSIKKIKERFDNYVNLHLKFKPLSISEEEKLGDLPNYYAYGTTLLAVKITKEDTVMLQIGDGKIHAVNRNGNFFQDLPDDDNCFGTYTSSLVTENALSKIRFKQYKEPAACVILYTDGYKPNGDYPWKILENLDLSLTATDLEKEVQSGDKYKDDQTFLLYFDDTAISSSFHEGIAKEKEIYIKKRNILRVKEEIKSLESFLVAAIAKYKKLPIEQKETFKKKSILPRYEEYLKLKHKLESF